MQVKRSSVQFDNIKLLREKCGNTRYQSKKVKVGEFEATTSGGV